MAEISLNEIISTLSDTVGQPFNVPLQEKLKVIVNYKRANYTQQLLEKHPDQRRFFWQNFTTDLEEVDSSECNDVPADLSCKILVTKCTVPTPLRSSVALFDYVGNSVFTDGYGEIRPEYILYNKFNKFTADKTKYAYIGKKIYVFNNLQIKKLGVRGVFTDPYSINSCCSGDSCFDDDSAYPIFPDILNSIIRDILNVELRNQFPREGVVSESQNKDTDRPVNT